MTPRAKGTNSSDAYLVTTAAVSNTPTTTAKPMDRFCTARTPRAMDTAMRLNAMASKVAKFPRCIVGPAAANAAAATRPTRGVNSRLQKVKIEAVAVSINAKLNSRTSVRPPTRSSVAAINGYTTGDPEKYPAGLSYNTSPWNRWAISRCPVQMYRPSSRNAEFDSRRVNAAWIARTRAIGINLIQRWAPSRLFAGRNDATTSCHVGIDRVPCSVPRVDAAVLMARSPFRAQG